MPAAGATAPAVAHTATNAVTSFFFKGFSSRSVPPAGYEDGESSPPAQPIRPDREDSYRPVDARRQIFILSGPMSRAAREAVLAAGLDLLHDSGVRAGVGHVRLEQAARR